MEGMWCGGDDVMWRVCDVERMWFGGDVVWRGCDVNGDVMWRGCGVGGVVCNFVL